MKKLIFIVVFVLMAQFSFAQSLQKGNLLGLHVITVNLQSSTTIDQFTNFFINRVIPEYEKHFNAKGYIVKGVRGDNTNSFGIIWLFNTEQSRDKYFNNDGSFTDVGKSVIEKVTPVDDELKKLGTYTSKYTDWVVL